MRSTDPLTALLGSSGDGKAIAERAARTPREWAADGAPGLPPATSMRHITGSLCVSSPSRPSLEARECHIGGTYTGATPFMGVSTPVFSRLQPAVKESFGLSIPSVTRDGDYVDHGTCSARR